MPTPRIAIVGAGIGGLTLALALRARGIPAEVYEQADRLTEIGAAVALSANATREFERLGCLGDVAALATEPTELVYRGWRDERRIAAFPVREGGAYYTRFGAPYLGIHRADLQTALSGAFGTQGLHLGHKLSTIADEGRESVLTFANSEEVAADLVVGADGVRSVARRFVTGDTATGYSGTSAFRGIVPMDRLPSLPDPEAIQFWMGPDAHVLHYAIGAKADSVNFFAVVEGPARWPHEDRWTDAIAPGDHLAAFAGWAPAMIEMLGALPQTQRWGLFTVKPQRRWHRGRVVLIGDAVHAMLPHHGQGANTTIEDAVTLAEMLSGGGLHDLPGVLQGYQERRRLRTRMIQRSSAVTNDLLHLPDGPALPARDAKVARFPDRFDWIHAHDALAAASEPTRGVAA